MNDAAAPLMLGVSGLRGIVGKSLTPAVAADYAAAIARWLSQRHPDAKPPHVVIGRDSRRSGKALELAVTSGLLACGCNVTRLGVASTPGVAVMVEKLGAQGGIVLTASHNPAPWNGIKTLTEQGIAPEPEQAQRIISTFGQKDFQHVPHDALGILRDDGETARVHVDRVLANIDVQAVRNARFKVVVDSVHGAGGIEAALLLSELGTELVHLYAQPTGEFPHVPEPLEENLGELCQVTRNERADAGFAQDPDADRLVITDEAGTYIGEEYTLALACEHVLSKLPKGHNAVVPTNLSTSRMIDDIATRHGATVLRTPVGEANVASAMRKHESVIGGEGNGGVIWAPAVYVRDSISGMALVLEMLAQRKQPLSALVAQLPRYVIVKTKLPLPQNKPDFAGALTQAFPGAKCDVQDGVRIDAAEGWVHVRTSNTEPIMRIIAEARDETAAQQMIDRVRKALGV